MPHAVEGQDALMRRDGYVTASEVAEATGKHLVTIHRSIAEERIPGLRVGWSWYVDIHRYYEICTYPPGTSIANNLRTLTMLVGRRAAKRPVLSVPKKKKRVSNGR